MQMEQTDLYDFMKKRQFSHLITVINSSKIRLKKPERSWMIDVGTSDWKRESSVLYHSS